MSTNEREERRKDVEENPEQFCDFKRDPKTQKFKLVTKPDGPSPGNENQDKSVVCKYGGGFFKVSDGGVDYAPPPDSDKQAVRICAPLYVVARTRDSHGKVWGHLLRWQDAGWHTARVGDAG